MAFRTLTQLRRRTETILSFVNTTDSYRDSDDELSDINEAYEQTAYAYNWKELLFRVGIAKVANLDRYSFPSNFRKARTIKLDGVTLEETELEYLKRKRYGWAYDGQQNDIILSIVPSAASTAFTLSNAESAGSAVTIELDTTSGLTQLDEIWIDSASGTDEFSMVSSISGNNIVARLDSAKSASDIIYRQKDIIDILYYRLITRLINGGDTTLLPDSTDFIIPHYAAHLAFFRMELFDKADAQLKQWKERLFEAWNAHGRPGTGSVSQFTIA